MGSVTLAVLSGGRGRRIGGYKPLVTLCGRPLVCHVLGNLAPLAQERLLIVHDPSQAASLKKAVKACGFRASVISDLPGENLPITGIYTASLYSTGEIIAVAPSDTPFLTARPYERLLARLGDKDAAVPLWPNGYVEPLIAVYRSEPLRRATRKALEEGRLRSRSPLDYMDVVYVPVGEVFDDPQLETFNINSSKDLEEAERLCKSIRQREAPAV